MHITKDIKLLLVILAEHLTGNQKGCAINSRRRYLNKAFSEGAYYDLFTCLFTQG